MDTDELEPVKKIKKIDFDELSIEELKIIFLKWRQKSKSVMSISKVNKSDKLKAEELFK
jgi:hypothetical protein